MSHKISKQEISKREIEEIEEIIRKLKACGNRLMELDAEMERVLPLRTDYCPLSQK
ncbi:hypothetical protein ACJU26_09555 [Acidithiobacillus sp. M4-SHS-6]|uniref:hypothetical protein n=1 Tax=Acidithiobacillus sp. M4-SHS-6 TaxID=3383024 RepID=UPI0039BEAFA5